MHVSRSGSVVAMGAHLRSEVRLSTDDHGRGRGLRVGGVGGGAAQHGERHVRIERAHGNEAEEAAGGARRRFLTHALSWSCREGWCGVVCWQASYPVRRDVLQGMMWCAVSRDVMCCSML